jgi:hypothetical protein
MEGELSRDVYIHHIFPYLHPDEISILTRAIPYIRNLFDAWKRLEMLTTLPEGRRIQSDKAFAGFSKCIPSLKPSYYKILAENSICSQCLSARHIESKCCYNVRIHCGFCKQSDFGWKCAPWNVFEKSPPIEPGCLKCHICTGLVPPFEKGTQSSIMSGCTNCRIFFCPACVPYRCESCSKLVRPPVAHLCKKLEDRWNAWIYKTFPKPAFSVACWNRHFYAIVDNSDNMVVVAFTDFDTDTARVRYSLDHLTKIQLRNNHYPRLPAGLHVYSMTNVEPGDESINLNIVF